MNERRTWLLLTAALFGSVLLCFWPGLGNFLAGDDFNWVFDGVKTIQRPSHFLIPEYHFVRHVELAYFVVNLLLARLGLATFQLSALLLHAGCAVLLARLVVRLGGERGEALVIALFWALTYKHVEVVLRPYAVADSLALLLGLAAMLAHLARRPVLATLCLVVALFSKENALVFAPLVTLHAALFTDRAERRSWLLRTLPLWGVSALFAGFEAWIRLGLPTVVPFGFAGFTRFWENVLSYVGPHPAWLRHAVLGQDATLVPLWLAALLWLALAVAIWRLRGLARFGLAWMTLFMLPTASYAYQGSRYEYVPLVGVWMVLGHGLYAWVRRAAERGRRRTAAGLVAVGGAVLLYFLVGINLEQSDYALMGEMHRQAAQSFRRDVLPELPEGPGSMTVFLRPPARPWLEELYAHSLLKPWWAPATYKWFYPRTTGILGQASTYGFVTWCAWGERDSPLFVVVPYPEFAERLARGDFVAVIHDGASNSFSIGPPGLVAELATRPPTRDLYAALQPGRFDPSASGSTLEVAAKAEGPE